MAAIDHIAICPADIDASLRFYVEGIGLDVLFDVQLDMDLEPLLGVATKKPRTIFLGRKGVPGAALELFVDEAAPVPAGSSAAGRPHLGAFLVSFHVPVQETLDRLASMGLGGEPHVMPVPGGALSATVVDPDGVMVELLDNPVSLGS